MRSNTEYVRERAANDPEFHERRKRATRAWKARHLAKINAIVSAAKDRPCADCGVQYHSCCMEFDHIRGEKLFGLAKASRTSRTIADVQAEIAKCEIRCVICHRMRHLADRLAA